MTRTELSERLHTLALRFDWHGDEVGYRTALALKSEVDEGPVSEGPRLIRESVEAWAELRGAKEEAEVGSSNL